MQAVRKRNVHYTHTYRSYSSGLLFLLLLFIIEEAGLSGLSEWAYSRARLD